MELIALIFIVFVAYFIFRPPSAKHDSSQDKIKINNELNSDDTKKSKDLRNNRAEYQISKEQNIKQTSPVRVKMAFNIVGMRFHKIPFDVRDVVKKERVQLLLEPYNPHDEDAVACYLRETKIGFINREKAAEIAPLLRMKMTYEIQFIQLFSQSIGMELRYSKT